MCGRGHGRDSGWCSDEVVLVVSEDASATRQSTVCPSVHLVVYSRFVLLTDRSGQTFSNRVYINALGLSGLVDTGSKRGRGSPPPSGDG